jgi:signal transduction histidine kinase
LAVETLEAGDGLQAELTRSDYEAFRKPNNLAGMKAGMLQALVLLPPFVFLDLFLIPEDFVVVQVARVITLVCVLALIVAINRRPEWVARRSDVLWFAIAWIIGVFCAICCWAHTGYDSVYTFSLMFVFMSSALSVSWPAWLSATCAVTIYLTYVSPLFFGLVTIDDWEMTLGFQLFIIGVMVQTVMMHRGRYESESRAFFANVALQNTKASLEQAYQQLQEVDRLKSEFFANISHELRTPLTLVISPVTEMLRSAGPGAEANALKVVLRNATRLLRMIDDLLDLAKLEAGGLRLNVSDLDVGDLAKRVAENARPAAEARGIDLRFSTSGSPPEMFGDAHRIEIILTNLIGNAMKFTLRDGTIDVHVIYNRAGASVEVADTGPGIPKDQQGRIFDRFHQTDGSERRKTGGVGIGLSLARELAQLHGGSVTVESELGKGSTFTLFLQGGKDHFHQEIVERREAQVDVHPSRRAEDRTKIQDALSMENATAELRQSAWPSKQLLLDRGRVPRLLIAEDEDDLRGFIAGVLKESYVVDAAADGAEALKLLEQNRPDLVLTDVMMPGTSGIDLCRAIKGNPSLKHIPVILLTARGQDDAALEGYEAGADDYVAKPFHAKVLQARIHAHLKMRALSLQLADQARLASAGTLAAGLAHEVKNPLNAAINAVKVLANGGSSRVSGERLMAVIVDGLDRIDGVVSALNAHVRPADGTNLVPCDVREAVESTLNLLEHKLRNEVEVHQDYETTDDIFAPARAFNQVLLNLIDNSIRSGAKSIWIEVRQVDRNVSVAVADDGPGVPPDVVHRIFDPFFTTRVEGEGTGLGLHLSRRIAQECGGELRYEPRTGGGARFVMEIPAMEQAA